MRFLGLARPECVKTEIATVGWTRERGRERTPIFFRGGLVEVTLWSLLAIACIAGAFLHNHVRPGLSNDSYQYLSTADNVAKRHSASTSIVYFDVERKHGRIPAPLTTFPIGYPAAVAGLSVLHMPLLEAGWLISALSVISLVPLIWMAANILELNLWTTRLVLAWLLTNTLVLANSTGVCTEPLFTALSFAGLTLLLKQECATDSPTITAYGICGLVLIGLSHWVRYAGLFFFAGVGLYYLLLVLRERSRRASARLLCVGIPAVIIGANMGRNAVLAGTWRGGNTRMSHHAVATTLKLLVQSIYRLVPGGGGALRLEVGQIVLLAGLVIIGFVVVRYWRVLGSSWRQSCNLLPWLLIASCVCVYFAGMFYLGMFSDIDLSSRMFFPLLPILLISAGGLLTAITQSNALRRTVVIGAILTSAGYILLQLHGLAQSPEMQPDEVVLQRFKGRTKDGKELLSWFQTSVPKDAIVVATYGQATAYALRRMTVGLAESQYSEEVWTESAIRKLMVNYGAKYLIVYPGLDPRIASEQQESQFIRTLVDGHIPKWLTIAAGNSGVQVFRTLE